jgi:hypothetical protein
MPAISPEFLTADAERRSATEFPVGYHHIHPDVSVNYQMNRWLTWMGADSGAALEELRSVAPRISRGTSSQGAVLHPRGRVFHAARHPGEGACAAEVRAAHA